MLTNNELKIYYMRDNHTFVPLKGSVQDMIDQCVPEMSKRIKITSKKLRGIERGNVTIVTLIRIAKVFDCALDVRLISTIDQVKQLNKEPEIVPTFEEEILFTHF